MTTPLDPSVEQIRLLDLLAANAWPATVCEPIGEWVCRYTHGVTRRANSVWPRGWPDGADLALGVAEAAEFYARHDQDTIFQISPACGPRNLDHMLDSGGFSLEAPTDVMTAGTANVLGAIIQHHRVTLLDHVDDRWMSGYMPGTWTAPAGKIRRSIIERIAPPRVLALIEDSEGVTGVGMAVCEQGWAGIFNMHTAERCRGQGIASAILHRFAAWAIDRSAPQLYLQVEQDNGPAANLYTKAGFETLYTYHYRRGSQANVAEG